MSDFLSLLEAAARMRAVQRDLEAAGPEIVKTAAQMVAARAKASMGTASGFNWPALAPSTIARKTQPGMLLETADLQSSIEWNSDGLVAHVGSNLDRAVFIELGSSKMPPRSFLMASAIDQGPKIAKMAGRVVRAAFAGHGPAGSRLHEIMELLHILKDFVDDIVDIAKDAGKPSRRR